MFVDSGRVQTCEPYTLIETFGGVEQIWEHEFSISRQMDGAIYSQLSSDGMWYMTTGEYKDNTTTIVTMKRDTRGDVLWEQTYRGPDGSNDIPRAIQIDVNGDVVVAGLGYQQNLGGKLDVVYLRYDPDGNELARLYHTQTDTIGEQPWALAPDGRGNMYMLGRQEPSSIFIASYAPDGTRNWYVALPGEGDAAGLITDHQNNAYIAGEMRRGATTDATLVKVSPDGEVLWTRHHKRPQQQSSIFWHLAVDVNGNVYAGGNARSWDYFDFLIAKYSPDGEELWVRTYGFLADDDNMADMKLSPEGDIIVFGHTMKSGTYRWTLISYTPDGAVRWMTPWGGGGPCPIQYTAARIVVDPSGNIYAVGKSENNRNLGGDQDMLVVTFDSNGKPLSGIQFDTRGWGRGIKTVGAALDQHGVLHVSFSFMPSIFMDVYQLLKYAWDWTSIDAEDQEVDIPVGSGLLVYPNPASGIVSIEYRLARHSSFEIELFDALGRRVAQVYSGSSGAGLHTVTWDSRSVGPGTYFFRLAMPGQPGRTRRLVVI